MYVKIWFNTLYLLGYWQFYSKYDDERINHCSDCWQVPIEHETNEHANKEYANETMGAFWSNELLKLKSCLEPACSWFQNHYLLDSDLSLSSEPSPSLSSDTISWYMWGSCVGDCISAEGCDIPRTRFYCIYCGTSGVISRCLDILQQFCNNNTFVTTILLSHRTVFQIPKCPQLMLPPCFLQKLSKQ